MMEELKEKRREIKDITLKILELVKRRLKLAKDIGDIKRKLDLPVEDYNVEAELKREVVDYCIREDLDPQLGLKVLSLLIQESIKMEREKDAFNLTQVIQEARRLEKEGKEVIHLEVGELDFEPVKEALKGVEEGLRKGLYRYSDAKGDLELRRRLAKEFNQIYSLNLKEENILITPGGRFALYLTFKSLIKMGEEVIGFEPLYPPYRQICELEGIRFIPIRTELEKGWSPDINLVQKNISKLTRMMVINYPNNPTGKILSRREMEELVSIAKDWDLFILNDEVYSSFSFKGPFNSLLTFNYDKSIVISSFSKSHSMSGFRVGYIIAKEEIIDKIGKLQSLMITCMPPFLQYSALKALEAKTKKFVEEIKIRAKEVSKRLKDLPVRFYEPDGSLYIFPEVTKKEFNSDKFVKDMLYKHGVALASGKNFGDYPKNFRLSLCQPLEKLLESIDKMKKELE